MPVIVIGADTPLGPDIVSALVQRDGEVRVFVSDTDAGARFKDLGLKVAIGDVSDGSHVGGAALACFSAIAVVSATLDRRERAFASSPEAVLSAWAEALLDAGVHRVIEVADPEAPVGSLAGAAPEHAVVETSGRTSIEVAAEVARLDDAASLG